MCNPAQFLRGIFSGQMNTTLPKIEGRPLCSVLLSACYHTAGQKLTIICAGPRAAGGGGEPNCAGRGPGAFCYCGC